MYAIDLSFDLNPTFDVFIIYFLLIKYLPILNFYIINKKLYFKIFRISIVIMTWKNLYSKFKIKALKHIKNQISKIHIMY